MAYTKTKLIPPHGGYRKLKSYQMAEIIYDLTVAFCDRYKSYLTYKTYEQMTGAARSGKQNIAEGSMDSGTSKKIELKLVNIARGSLEELLLDYEDFLRQRNLSLWAKDSSKARAVRRLAYKSHKSYTTYKSYIESDSAEEAANCLICLIHQANYLLDQQLRSLEKDFLEKGGFTERMFRARSRARNK
jgi:four helix bundle suffix protein